MAPVLFSLVIFSCGSGENTMPDELIGIWMTPAPKYEECFFELTPKMVVYGSGHFFEHLDINYLLRVEKNQKKTHTLYTIHYENAEGQKLKLELFYLQKKGGRIRFKHQKKILWQKVREEDLSPYLRLSP